MLEFCFIYLHTVDCRLSDKFISHSAADCGVLMRDDIGILSSIFVPTFFLALVRSWPSELITDTRGSELFLDWDKQFFCT